MDLFSAADENLRQKEAPLAARMRPEKLEEFFGQEEIIGPGKLLRRSIQADRLSSMILFGPAGTGKTTLALLVAKYTKAHFEKVNAVTSGVAEVRRLIKEAKERRTFHRQKTVVFIDEIHRFNKGQQDALLPAVEDGTILLIGATTENPYYEVNSPLLSRSRIFRLKPLDQGDMKGIIERALKDKEKGLGEYQVDISSEAVDHLINVADGDARTALNGLEVAVLSTEPAADGVRRITPEIIEESVQERIIRYDKTGEGHYHTISAFIKSIRGSDPDAAVHYLAKMLSAGEDPRFIARRMIVHAAEDIGMADSKALMIAVSAAQALEMVGLPEARIPLAEAAIYLATAPKSNSVCKAIDGAMQDIQRLEQGSIPLHLCDASHPGSTKLGYGKGYKYPHDYPGHYVDQQYLPAELEGKRYYLPEELGYEKEVKKRMEEREKKY